MNLTSVLRDKNLPEKYTVGTLVTLTHNKKLHLLVQMNGLQTIPYFP
jgi:hypothetical protein